MALKRIMKVLRDLSLHARQCTSIQDGIRILTPTLTLCTFRSCRRFPGCGRGFPSPICPRASYFAAHQAPLPPPAPLPPVSPCMERSRVSRPVSPCSAVSHRVPPPDGETRCTNPRYGSSLYAPLGIDLMLSPDKDPKGSRCHVAGVEGPE